MSLLFLNLFLDPKVCKSQPILQQHSKFRCENLGVIKKLYKQESGCRSINTFNFIVGAQPSFSLISVLSELRPRTPSGPGMWWMGSVLFSKLRTISAISFMLTISSLPIFTGSRKSDFVNLNAQRITSKISLYQIIFFTIRLFEEVKQFTK